VVRPEDLYAEPNALAPDYAQFDVAHRLLLTGHSHQAWPDRARAGQLRAFEDAARWVDQKWEAAFDAAQRVRAGFAALLGDRPERIALGASTHELVVRLLSALPLRRRPRLLSTDGEFHTLRRQLDRLAEEGVEVVRVPSAPADEVASRLAGLVDDRSAAVLVSAVLYRNGQRVPGLGELARACGRVGAELLVDAYHALGAVPWEQWPGLEGAYVVGGGYKYCQLGEGCCFLRLPERCALRPVVTGWFAEFGALADDPAHPGRVAYASGPERFAGATYDPTSHYRGAEVFAFFAERGLVPPLLREVSQHQVRLLADGIDALDPDPRRLRREREVPLERLGGFLALHCPRAEELVALLRQRGVHADQRGGILRLGPAPYLCDRQLRDALAALGESLRALPPA
jgi:selenocysteine lyase/cysteine desulfurase